MSNEIIVHAASLIIGIIAGYLLAVANISITTKYTMRRRANGRWFLYDAETQKFTRKGLVINENCKEKETSGK